MVKAVRFVFAVLGGAWAVGAGFGCGTDKPATIVAGTGGNGAAPSGSGGAAGQSVPSGLQFNGSITFVRGQR